MSTILYTVIGIAVGFIAGVLVMRWSVGRCVENIIDELNLEER